MTVRREEVVYGHMTDCQPMVFRISNDDMVISNDNVFFSALITVKAGINPTDI